MNPYLRRFMAIGIPVGLLMGIVYSLQYGFPLGLGYGILIGIVVGTAMSLLFGFLNRRSVIWRLRSKSQAARGIHPVRRVEMQLPYQAVYHLCLDSLQVIRNCHIQREEWIEGRIMARTEATWRSRGDRISFEIYPIDRDRIQVKVSSKPIVETELVDPNKNLEDVEKIARFLSAQNQDWTQPTNSGRSVGNWIIP